MDHLWAPWRMTYIREGLDKPGCLFCNLLQMDDGQENLIIHRGDHNFVVLNRYPYTNGHIMIVPYDHVPSLEGLSSETLTEMMELSQQALRVLRTQYRAEAFNLGSNIGEESGAGVAEHVHLHIVPRWKGDTNFMATTAETRVLPEAIEVTYQTLCEHWK
jgi:ATP adenylyltransferase